MSTSEPPALEGKLWSFERRQGEPAVAHRLRCIDNAIGIGESVLLAVFLVTLVGVGTVQAIAGNVFDKTFTSTNEIVRSMVFFIAMTGAALAAQRNRLISMDVLSRLLSPRPKAILRVVLGVFTLAMVGLFLHSSWELYQLAKGEHALLIPSSISVLFLPAGAALIGIHIGLHAIIDAAYLAAGLIPPDPAAPPV